MPTFWYVFEPEDLEQEDDQRMGGVHHDKAGALEVQDGQQSQEAGGAKVDPQESLGAVPME